MVGVGEAFFYQMKVSVDISALNFHGKLLIQGHNFVFLVTYTMRNLISNSYLESHTFKEAVKTWFQNHLNLSISAGFVSFQECGFHWEQSIKYLWTQIHGIINTCELGAIDFTVPLIVHGKGYFTMHSNNKCIKDDRAFRYYWVKNEKGIHNNG